MLDLSLPSGLRDLLPDHSAHLAELSGRLQEVFSSFGYRRLFLPTLERLEVMDPREATVLKMRFGLANLFFTEDRKLTRQEVESFRKATDQPLQVFRVPGALYLDFRRRNGNLPKITGG